MILLERSSSINFSVDSTSLKNPQNLNIFSINILVVLCKMFSKYNMIFWPNIFNFHIKLIWNWNHHWSVATFEICLGTRQLRREICIFPDVRGKFLPRLNCLNIIHVYFWINYWKSKKIFIFIYFLNKLFFLVYVSEHWTTFMCVFLQKKMQSSLGVTRLGT